MADRVADWVTEWTRAKNRALEYIDAMPDELIGFKPVPDVFSFARQMVHIANVNYMLASGVAGIENPRDVRKGRNWELDDYLLNSKSAVREFAAGSYDFMLTAIEKLTPETLDETISFAKWSITRETILAKAYAHYAHHRGQTAIYFRLNGLTPPSDRLFS